MKSSLLTLIAVQLANKFPALYGKRRFITKFTSPHWSPLLSQLDAVHALQHSVYSVYLTTLPVAKISAGDELLSTEHWWHVLQRAPKHSEKIQSQRNFVYHKYPKLPRASQ